MEDYSIPLGGKHPSMTFFGDANSQQTQVAEFEENEWHYMDAKFDEIRIVQPLLTSKYQLNITYTPEN